MRILVAALLAIAGLFSSVAHADLWLQQPGTYRLDRDYYGEKIRIAGHDITLDCQGHRVWATTGGGLFHGPGSAVNGIFVWHAQGDYWLRNVTVMNCNVAGWDA